MVESMRQVVTQGVAAYAPERRGEWVLKWPGQVVLAVTAIFWTQVRPLGQRNSPPYSPCLQPGVS
jgi:hypothetical protein